jgi:peptidoglycan/LPS O-acetylase OafA/YrhL
MIVATILVGTQPIRGIAVACELAFVQNYGPGLWVHTWSLAVEEHFYFLVAFAFWLWQRRAPTPTRRQLVTVIVAFFVACLVARVATVALVPARLKLTVYGTHMRLDALALGALIAWLRARHPAALARWVRAHRLALAVGATAALLVVFVGPQPHVWLHTVGLMLVYGGYGAWMLLVLEHGDGATATAPPSWPARLGCAIGRASYGIYLWHLFAVEEATRFWPWLVSSWATQIPVAVTVGMLLSRLIEDPFLRLRDRVVPRLAG